MARPVTNSRAEASATENRCPTIAGTKRIAKGPHCPRSVPPVSIKFVERFLTNYPLEDSTWGGVGPPKKSTLRYRLISDVIDPAVCCSISLFSPDLGLA
jgi:hypothetical protein